MFFIEQSTSLLNEVASIKAAAIKIYFFKAKCFGITWYIPPLERHLVLFVIRIIHCLLKTLRNPSTSNIFKSQARLPLIHRILGFRVRLGYFFEEYLMLTAITKIILIIKFSRN